MMSIRRMMTYILLTAIVPVNTIYGQGSDLLKVKGIIDELKKTGDVSYSYAMHMLYPNLHRENVTGSMYVSNKNKLLLNDNNAFTMLYTAHWFYKADHKKKTISIVNLDKEEDAELKRRIEQELFENGSLTEFLDSVVMKRGQLKSYGMNKDTVKFEIVFPTELIKSISIDYQSKNRTMISYRMVTFQPTDETEDGVEGIMQTVTCSGFQKKVNIKKCEPGNFFSLENGSIVLKKYNRYKIIQ